MGTAAKGQSSASQHFSSRCGNAGNSQMRRVDLADYLGLTSETVSRSLTKKGIIEMHGPRGIEIFEYCVL